jgi:hypothetical protein
MDEISRSNSKYLIFNNLIFDAIGDLFLTIGFVPFLLFFLCVTDYLPLDFLTEHLQLFNVLTAFGQLALLLFLYTTIASIDDTNKVLKGAVYYFCLGVLYFIVEIILIFTFESLLSKDPASASFLLNSFMPRNYLLSISSFLFLGYFLMYTPKKIENSKHKNIYIIFFRLLSLICLAYIIGSYVLSIVSTFGYIDIPLEVSILFSGQYFFQEVFGIILIFLLYIKKEINESRLKNNESPISITQFQTNIIVCSILLVLSIIDFVLSAVFEFNDGFYVSELGTIRYAIFLIPIFLLFKNDDSEHKYKKTFFALDWYYTMIYIILAIVYIILYLAQFGFTF